jgi:hypothetical protein
VAGLWTRHAVRVCHSRFARSLRWFHVGGGRLIGKAGTQFAGHTMEANYSWKVAAGTANCRLRNSPEGCGIVCRSVHFAD